MDEGETYIRGANAKRVDGRRVVLVLGWSLAVILVAISAYLIVETHHHNSTSAALRQHGVPVRVTVTGCQGISSGIGMGIEYWDCSGTFSVAGQTYNEVIGNSRSQHPTGAVLDAVVVPSNPSSVALRTSRDSSYVPAIVVSAVTLVVIIGLAGWTRRVRRSAQADPVAAR